MFRPNSFGLLSSRAKPRLANIVRGMAMMANLNVTMSDLMTLGSLVIRM